jgi:hypothetical protein
MSEAAVPSPAAPRWSLAGLSLAHALVLGWAAWMLPWQRWTVFAATTALLAAGHAATALLALAGAPRRRAVWRATSLLALAYLALHTFVALRAGLYIAALYGGLGRGVAAGLAAAWCVLAAFTVPLAAWGVAATGGLPRPRVPGGRVSLLAALLALGALGLWQAAAAAAATPLAHPAGDPAALAGELAAALPKKPVPKDRPKTALWTRHPAACDGPLDRPTALVTYPVADAAAPGKRPPLRGQTRCVQADDVAGLVPALAATVADAAAPGPMKIDVVTAAQPLADALPGPTPLLLRPGLDGVCAGRRCLAPWQLVALGQFNTYTPLPFIEDLRFGSDPAHLHRALARADEAPPERLDGLVRIATASYIVDPRGAVAHAPRMRAPLAALDAPRLAAAAAAAERHVLAAQAKDGRFRYILQPFTGKVTWRGFAVPRQAGTTLALCELGGPDATAAAARSLAMMATLERPAGAAAALVYDEPGRPPRRVASLGDTALPLIAYLSCRPRTGPAHDALIGRLARLLLTMQRDDGGFHPRFDLDAGAPQPGPAPMYAEGQVVFALTLLEGLLADAPPPDLPAHAEVRAAVERAMTYFAGDYWGHGLYGFGFLEENWHCLAARAALKVHPHAGYERFCLDYVDFKRRLIMTDDVADDLVGAYGFGQVLPPHNTPTGGFGEALAAAMDIRAARGTEDPADAALMRTVLTFLVAQQWTDANCFACTPDHRVVGGYSESVASPDLRIDYTQHVWSALGHGGRVLGLLPGAPG